MFGGWYDTDTNWRCLEDDMIQTPTDDVWRMIWYRHQLTMFGGWYDTDTNWRCLEDDMIQTPTDDVWRMIWYRHQLTSCLVSASSFFAFSNSCLSLFPRLSVWCCWAVATSTIVWTPLNINSVIYWAVATSTIVWTPLNINSVIYWAVATFTFIRTQLNINSVIYYKLFSYIALNHTQINVNILMKWQF